jgi:hypothetical protein
MLSRSVQADDQVLFTIIRAADVNVVFREACLTKTLSHCLRRGGHIAYRIRGVDLDQLLENVVSKLLGRAVDLSIQVRNQHDSAQQKRKPAQVPSRDDNRSGIQQTEDSNQARAMSSILRRNDAPKPALADAEPLD